jgi:hypothetical protein
MVCSGDYCFRGRPTVACDGGWWRRCGFVILLSSDYGFVVVLPPDATAVGGGDGEASFPLTSVTPFLPFLPLKVIVLLGVVVALSSDATSVGVHSLSVGFSAGDLSCCLPVCGSQND